MTPKIPPAAARTTLVGVAGLALVYAVCVAVARSRLATASPRAVPLALAFDLTVTASAVAYVLLVRTGSWPARRLRVVAMLGLSASALLLPEIAAHARALSVVAEGALLVFLATRLRVAAAAVRARPFGEPRMAAFERKLAGALGATLAAAISAEVFVFVYAFAGPWLRPPEGLRVFTDYKARQLGALVFSLLLITAMEAIPLHLLVARASQTAAWLLLAVQLYGAAWLVAEWQAHRLEPIVLADDALYVTIGLRLRARIPLAQIAHVGAPDPSAKALKATAWTEPTVAVTLHAPIDVTGPLGLRRRTAVLHLSVDAPEAFTSAVRAAREAG